MGLSAWGVGCGAGLTGVDKMEGEGLREEDKMEGAGLSWSEVMGLEGGGICCGTGLAGGADKMEGEGLSWMGAGGVDLYDVTAYAGLLCCDDVAGAEGAGLLEGVKIEGAGCRGAWGGGAAIGFADL